MSADLVNVAALSGAAVALLSASASVVYNIWSFRKAEQLKADAIIRMEVERKVYTDIQPLLFQLAEAAEGGFHAVTSLSRQQRLGNLPSALSVDGYYIRSIAYRILLPLTYLRLMQRSTSLLDHTRHPIIHLQYRCLKHCFIVFTDPHGVAQACGVSVYNDHELAAQGIFILRLEALIDSLIVENGSKARPMTFGEFERFLEDESETDGSRYYKYFFDLLDGFSFSRKPVTGRILLCYACLLHGFLMLYKDKVGSGVTLDVEKTLLSSAEGKNFFEFGDDSAVLYESESLNNYIIGRLKQINDEWAYAKS